MLKYINATSTRQVAYLTPISETYSRPHHHYTHTLSRREHTYTVYMSFVQIYMEDIHDLLKPGSEPLQLREDPNNGGVFLENVQEVQIRSVEECLQLLQLGERCVLAWSGCR